MPHRPRCQPLFFFSMAHGEHDEAIYDRRTDSFVCKSKPRQANALAFASRSREQQLTIDHGTPKLACRARFHDGALATATRALEHPK
jgi:hypothetical protein